MNKLLPLFLIFFSVGGCAVKGDYSCGIPKNGVKCQSLGETHKQLYDGTLASLHTDPFPVEDDTNQQATGAYFENSSPAMVYVNNHESSSYSIDTHRVQQPTIETVTANQAILSQPREMRIWFDRFTDAEGDLNDESFVFIRIDHGHWVIDNKPVLY